MGRPPDADEPRDVTVRLRAMADERAAWQRAAEQAGETLSSWLRTLANKAAKKAGQ